MSSSIDTWTRELAEDKDRDFIIAGLKDGFHITDHGSVFQAAECQNYKSATDTYNDLAESQVYKEIEQGRYVLVDRKPTLISSLGAVLKPGGKSVRLIHDCSRPIGRNLNSYASLDSFKYATIDSATKLIPTNGYVSKIDLKSAYRSVPIHPDCYPATGLQWTFRGNNVPTYLIDTRLPFGASRSCGIFQGLSDSVVRMMSRRGYTVVAYLDDFLVIAATKEQCQKAHNCLLQLLQELGFEINFDKVVPPCQGLTFLGVFVSSLNRTLSLPDSKVAELRDVLLSWSQKKKATKRELQQVIGKLAWAARVIRGGRTFLRRLIDLTCKLKHKHHHIRLNNDARADLSWWSNFMCIFNGTVHFIEDLPVPSDQFATDACMEGGGAFYKRDWFYVNWKLDMPVLADAHINAKELHTVCLAAEKWAPQWADSHIVVYTDNLNTMFAINKGTCRSKTMMPSIRRLFWLSALNNFHITARYIRGSQNIVSDCLSRLHDPKHFNLAASLFPWDCYLDNDSYMCLNLCGHVTYPTFMYLQDRLMMT